jgi:hypothetical protein
MSGLRRVSGSSGVADGSGALAYVLSISFCSSSIRVAYHVPRHAASRQFASRHAHLLSLSVRKARRLPTRRRAFQYS